MQRHLLYVLGGLLLVGCDSNGVVYEQEMAWAAAACANYSGLRYMYNTRQGTGVYRGQLEPTTVTALCRDGTAVHGVK